MSRHWTGELAGPGLGGNHEQPWMLEWERSSGAIRRARRWLLVSGVLSLLTGAASIAVPVVASVTIAIFIGWMLVLAGAAMAAYAVSHHSPVRGLEALLSLVAGLYVLVFPLSGTVTLTFVLAVWFFATGVLGLTLALEWRRVPGAWLQGLHGVLSVVLGVLIAASLPSSAAWAIGLLVGINLIFAGVRTLAAARMLKTAGQG